MLQQFKIDENFNKDLINTVIDAWKIDDNKIFHLINKNKKKISENFTKRLEI